MGFSRPFFNGKLWKCWEEKFPNISIESVAIYPLTPLNPCLVASQRQKIAMKVKWDLDLSQVNVSPFTTPLSAIRKFCVPKTSFAVPSGCCLTKDVTIIEMKWARDITRKIRTLSTLEIQFQRHLWLFGNIKNEVVTHEKWKGWENNLCKFNLKGEKIITNEGDFSLNHFDSLHKFMMEKII